MMHVARYNHAAQYSGGVNALAREIATLLSGGDHVLGPRVASFERHFAEFLGVAHVVGVNSGTDALLLSLLALGVGEGAEVITQANTFHATVAAICFAGARPVLVDADPQTYLMDLSQVEAAITPRTRAILPVHLFGKPTPMRELLRLAQQYGLTVVEDAAQAHGARRDGFMAGAAGAAGCFSFHPSKNLAAGGDAGAVATNDANLAEQLRVLRSLGQQGQNHHVRIGLNSKLDALQALVLDHKLPRLEDWNRQRACLAQQYRERLADTPLDYQATDAQETHVFHLFQVRTPQRDALLAWLNAKGVEASVRYPVPIHLQPAFAGLGLARGAFPVAEALADELLCLPMRADLSAAELDHVVGTVRGFFAAQP